MSRQVPAETYPSALGVSGTQPVFGFQSDVTDALTKSVDMGTRWYGPGQGRFSSRDVLFGSPMSPIGMNQWVYGGANPVTMHDPTGMRTEQCTGPCDGNTEQRNATAYSQHSAGSSWGDSYAIAIEAVRPAPVPVVDFLETMNDPDLSWEERTGAAEGLLSDHPRLGPDLVDGWINETFGGQLPETRDPDLVDRPRPRQRGDHSGVDRPGDRQRWRVRT